MKEDLVLPGLSNLSETVDILHQNGFFYTDYDADFGLPSKPLTELGFSYEDLSGGQYQKRIHPDDHPTYIRLWERFFSGKDKQLYCEYRLKSDAGSWSWLSTYAIGLRHDAEGKVRTIFGFDRIINSRKKTEQYLHQKIFEAEQKSKINEIILSAGSMVVSDLQMSENLHKGLSQLQEVVEFHSCSVFINRAGFSLLVSYPEDSAEPETNVPEILAELKESIYPIIADSDQSMYKSEMAVPLLHDDGLIGAIILYHKDPEAYRGVELYPVTAFADILSIAVMNHMTVNRLVDNLKKDRLSGMFTRSSFDNYSEKKWPELSTDEQKNVVVMIDIDNFKSINDTCGHQAGDDVIRHVSNIIRAALRETDLLGRYGGDEFIVILPNVSEKAAETIMDRIRLKVSEKKFGHGRQVTVSIGISLNRGNEELVSVIGRADRALYNSKNSGRNRIEFLP